MTPDDLIEALIVARVLERHDETVCLGEEAQVVMDMLTAMGLAARPFAVSDFPEPLDSEFEND